MSELSLDVVRVLLVEDDRDDYELTRDLLAEIGQGRRYDLEWVTEPEHALRALSAGTHDVCLLDYHLGATDGVDVLCQALRANARVPIILLTGRGNDGIEHRALAAGAADYLIKGQIDPPMLERSIRHSVERARSIEALRDRESQIRSVFEAALEAMLIADDEGRYVDANEAALALLGVSRGELLTMAVSDVMEEDAPARAAERWQAFLRDGRAEGEIILRRSNGERRIVEYRATSRIRPGLHLSVLRDVTVQRAAERHRSRLVAIVESAADAIDGCTLDGVIDYWSPAAERMYGYSAGEVLGRSKRVLLPDDRMGELDQFIARVRGGEALRDVQTARRRKDGSTFEASVTISPVLEDGCLVALSVITRDISEKKKMEAHLAVSDRMASVGTLAAGVAHEINNPLAAVMGNLDFLAECLSELCGSSAANALSLGDLREPLSDARCAADRIRHVVRDLMLFSKPDENQRGPVDLRRVIESSLKLAWNQIRHRARLVTDYGDVPPVEASEARLGQVCLNLIINAAHAIREGDAERNEIRITTRLEAGGRVITEVRDTGTGIAPEALNRLFEPFFTTKPAGVGTGLGLSICRRIIAEFGGTIEVESALGEGTVFRVALPAAVSNAVAAHDARTSAPPQRRGRVLVIDDEVVVAKALQRSLAPHHDVTIAGSPAAALEQLRCGASYDVIVCDMMMPQMTGPDFYRAFVEISPEAAPRVVFSTGGVFTAAAREFLDRIPNAKIEKPFELSQLCALIEERLVALDGGGCSSPAAVSPCGARAAAVVVDDRAHCLSRLE